jgi:regulator of replication initiation timing
MSHNLLTYKEARIEALINENKKLQLENEKLTTYIFELCDKSCPEDYKQVVQSDVFKR